MKSLRILTALAAVTIGLAAHPAFALDAKKGSDTKAAPAAQPSAQEQAMAQWMKLNAPGDAQQLLASWAGDWNFEMKSYMAPGQPPTVSKGTSSLKMILGGRYLQETASGDMGGQPFNGLGITAYDNVKKKYQGLWIDSSMTGFLDAEGDYDTASKTLTLNATTFDPMAGKDVPVKMVTRTVDDKTRVFEWWSPAPGGTDMTKMMEITYTRKM
jgi:hypothetical protein